MPLKPFNTTLSIIILAVILGIIFQDNWHVALSKIILFTGISILIGLLIFFKLKKGRFITTFLMSFWIGVISYSVNYAPNKTNHYINKLQPNQFYTLQGKIIDIKGNNTIVNLQYYDNQNIEGKILLTFKDSLSISTIGNTILFHSKLNPIPLPKNPYQFDFQKYMSHQNIFWKGYVYDYQTFPSSTFSITTFTAHLRNYLASSLNKYSFSADSQGIIKALLLGVRNDIQEETYQTYIDAGAVHILAISGLHIGIITMIISYILHFFFRKEKYKILILCALLSFLWFYALLTGLSASVVRAVTMFSFLSLALEMKKYQGVYDNLIASIFILLIFNPLYLFDVGFQLSYLAVFSIVTFLPIFNKWWFPENKFVRFFYGILGASFSVQIGIFPITLYYFHQIPSLFFITNLLILPFLGIILGIGIIVIILALIGILPNFLVVGYDFLIQQMNAIISKIASYENFIFREIYFDYKMLIISFIGIILLAFWLHFKNIRFLYGMLIAILVFQANIFYNKISQTTSELFVFQQYKTTLIAVRQGQKLTIFHSKSENISDKFLQNIISQMNIKDVDFQSIPNIFSFQGKNILIVDDSWYIDDSFPEINYMIIRNSPKIHLEKALQIIKPEQVIADATNFNWDIIKWKETCQKAKIPFHSTNEKGFFHINKK